MIVERKGDHWLAEGAGPLRPILSEGATRAEAVGGYAELFAKQERADYEAGILAEGRGYVVIENYEDRRGK